MADLAYAGPREALRSKAQSSEKKPHVVKRARRISPSQGLVVPARYVAEADEDELSPSSKKFAEDVFTRRASKEIMVDPQAKELYRCAGPRS